uniref:Ion_trans domain-containing protein n=1 Tax=Angiostrongylus cantonensis TaxID=6313 RepID=A0A158P8J5_ANGCA
VFKNIICRNTLEFYNSRSRVKHLDEEEKIVFLFDYSATSDRLYKKDNKWGVIRHPMVMNFVNERLLDCAFFYTLHVLAFAVFLLLLSSHIFSDTLAKDIAVTAFIALFLFFMLLKGAIKARISHSISFWFIIAYAFNIITYTATFLYVWLPTLFSYDDYHEETKKIVLWFLPIVAIISAWMNFLYILRKSPYGIYIFMMVRILRSFGHIATIWIPTLIAFSFAFHLIMRDSGTEPWETVRKLQHENATVIEKLFIILQAVTKTSTMMIGEVDANDILGTRQWIPSILVLVFEIITVILLMNLMVSLAVGDVSDLRNTAQDKILKIKVNFVIEALQLSEHFGLAGLSIQPLHKRRTNNVLVVQSDGATARARGVDPCTHAPPSLPSLRGQQIGTSLVWEDSSTGSIHRQATVSHCKGQICIQSPPTIPNELECMAHPSGIDQRRELYPFIALSP